MLKQTQYKIYPNEIGGIRSINYSCICNLQLKLQFVFPLKRWCLTWSISVTLSLSIWRPLNNLSSSKLRSLSPHKDILNIRRAAPGWSHACLRKYTEWIAGTSLSQQECKVLRVIWFPFLFFPFIGRATGLLSLLLQRDSVSCTVTQGQVSK